MNILTQRIVSAPSANPFVEFPRQQNTIRVRLTAARSENRSCVKPCAFEALPPEMHQQIFKKMFAKDLQNLRQTNRFFKNAIDSDTKLKAKVDSHNDLQAYSVIRRNFDGRTRNTSKKAEERMSAIVKDRTSLNKMLTELENYATRDCTTAEGVEIQAVAIGTSLCALIDETIGSSADRFGITEPIEQDVETIRKIVKNLPAENRKYIFEWIEQAPSAVLDTRDIWDIPSRLGGESQSPKWDRALYQIFGNFKTVPLSNSSVRADVMRMAPEVSGIDPGWERNHDRWTQWI